MVRSRAEYLINRLISNTLSDKELDELLEGIVNDETLKEYSPILEKYFNELVEQDNHDRNPEWPVGSEQGGASAEKRPTPRFFRMKLAPYRSMAAFIAVLLGIGSAYYFLSDNQPKRSKLLPPPNRLATHSSVPTKEETIPRGKRKSLRLSDGSYVKLNSETKMSFPREFGKTGRTVSLRGEAFFNVNRDASRPFVISLENLKINVLGTSFNVKDYADEQEVEITVQSGRVNVSLNSELSTPVILRKDQKLIFNKSTEKFKVIGVNAEQESSWINGSLQFNNTPLRRVEQILEKWYNVDIIIENESLYDASLTGKHLNESLVSMLESITYALDARYEIKGRTVLILN
ncbi:FecR domain-containing protein [Larkinella ripae]